MNVKVCVRGSPYHAVKRGEAGVIIGRKFINTTYEIIKVQFECGKVWSFHPDELTEVQDV